MTSNPLDGPFLTSLQLTDYSDDEDFAILPPVPGTGRASEDRKD